MSQGAIYTFLYNGSTENFIGYQRSADYATGGNDANSVNNISFGGAGMAWSGLVVGHRPGQQRRERRQRRQYVWGRTYNGSQVHYGWYQYMNVQATPQGVPGVNTGVVCSSSLALWQHDAGGLGDVNARTYSNDRHRANALWNGVQSDCNASTGWLSSVGGFFTNLGWSSLCVGVTGLHPGRLRPGRGSDGQLFRREQLRQHEQPRLATSATTTPRTTATPSGRP